jgi:hypothetical protein
LISSEILLLRVYLDDIAFIASMLDISGEDDFDVHISSDSDYDFDEPKPKVRHGPCVVEPQTELNARVSQRR